MTGGLAEDGKGETRYLLSDNGLASTYNTRGRRDDLRTFEAEGSRFLTEFKAWCGSEEARNLNDLLKALT